MCVCVYIYTYIIISWTEKKLQIYHTIFPLHTFLNYYKIQNIITSNCGVA